MWCLSLGLLPVEGTPNATFGIMSCSAAIPNPVSKATALFIRFDETEMNNLDPANFWGTRPPYVDFYRHRVPKDCVGHLEVVYHNHWDFMQRFPLGRSTREHFFKLLGCVINHIKHNFVDTVSVERFLQWRAVDAIDTRLESLWKEIADLEAHHERFLSDMIGSNRFQGETLISGLWSPIMYSATYYLRRFSSPLWYTWFPLALITIW